MPGPDIEWWCDKQIAIKTEDTVVRAWVMTTRRHEDARSGAAIGALTVVPLVGDPATAANYPGAFTIPVHAGGPHGRPVGVLGLWPEGDTGDVRKRADGVEHHQAQVDGFQT